MERRSMLNQVHDYLGHVPLERITTITAVPGRSWQKLTIGLVGGHSLEIEARGAIHELGCGLPRPDRQSPLTATRTVR